MKFRYFWFKGLNNQIQVAIWFVRMGKKTQELLGHIVFEEELLEFELWKTLIENPLNEFIEIQEFEQYNPLME